MAVVKYNRAMRDILNGDIDFNAPDDFRVLALELATDLDPDDVNITAVLANAGTTETTHTGMSVGDRISLGSETVTQDDTNDRAEWDGADITWSSVANDGGSTVKGILIYKFVTNDGDSIPIVFIDTGGFPITPNGGDITIQWNAEGILQLS